MNEPFVMFWTQVWQVTIVAAIVLAGVKLLGKNRPHLAHAMWALVLLKCVTPPVISSQLSPFSWLAAETNVARVVARNKQPLSDSNASSKSVRPIASLVHAPGLRLLSTKKPHTIKQSFETTLTKTQRSQASKFTAFDWKWTLLAVWLGGSAICLAVQSVRLLRFVVKLRQARVSSSANLEHRVQRLAKQIGLRRKVAVLVTELPLGPAVIGLFRPTVLLPRSIVVSDTDSHLDTVIAHELVHVRRGDLWWALLQMVAGVLFWFHPLVRLAITELTRQCERSCDEETVASLGIRPADYARALLDIFEQKQNLKPVPALPGVKPVEITSARLERVMKFGNGIHKRTPRWTWLVLLVCSALALPGAGLVLGQSEPESSASPLPSVVSQTTDQKSSETGDSEYLISYDVANILKKLQTDNPGKDIQEIELELLNRLRGTLNQGPQLMEQGDPKTRIITLQNNRIIAKLRGRMHDQIRQQMERILKVGLRQIVLDVCIATLPKNENDKIAWAGSPTCRFVGKNGEIHRIGGAIVTPSSDPNPVLYDTTDSEQAMKHAQHVDFAQLLSSPASVAAYHKMKNWESTSRPVFQASLTPQQYAAFRGERGVERVQCPLMAVNEGGSGTIVDGLQTPMVTQVVEIKGEEAAAYQPVISLVDEGVTVTINATTNTDDQFVLRGSLLTSELDGVDTLMFDSDGKPLKESDNMTGIAMQVPLVRANQLRFDNTLEPDRILALRTTNPQDREQDLVVFIKPKLVKDGTAVAEPALPEPIARDFYYIDEDTQYVADGKLNRSPKALLIRDDQTPNFDAICRKHDVPVSKTEEVNAAIAKQARQLGLTVDRLLELVEKDGSAEKYYRSVIARQIRFDKLPPQAQDETERPSLMFDALVVQSREASKNFETSQATKGADDSFDFILLKTKANVQVTGKRILLSGPDLEIRDAQFNLVAAADNLEAEFSADDGGVLKLVGNAKLKLECDLTADAITVSESDDCYYAAKGNVQLRLE